MLTHRASQLAGSMRAAPRLLAGAASLAPGPSHLRQSAHRRLASQATEYEGSEQFAAGANGAEYEVPTVEDPRPFIQVVEALPNQNMVSLMGHLGSDVSFAEPKPGLKLASARMVVNPRKMADGTVPQPVWFRLNWWAEKAAEPAERNFQKGEGLAVSGKLIVDTWADKNTGKQRVAYSVSIDYATRCQNFPEDTELADQYQ